MPYFNFNFVFRTSTGLITQFPTQTLLEDAATEEMYPVKNLLQQAGHTSKLLHNLLQQQQQQQHHQLRSPSMDDNSTIVKTEVFDEDIEEKWTGNEKKIGNDTMAVMADRIKTEPSEAPDGKIIDNRETMAIEQHQQ